MNHRHSQPSGNSRRELLVASLTAAAGGGAAALIASCGGGSVEDEVHRHREHDAGGERRRDPERAARPGAQLDRGVHADRHEAARAGACLRAAVRRPRAPPRRRARAGHPGARRHAHRRRARRPEYASGFPRLRGERDALSFALDVETTAVAAYSDALGKIATDGVRATAAAILVTESEHAVGGARRPRPPAGARAVRDRAAAAGGRAVRATRRQAIAGRAAGRAARGAAPAALAAATTTPEEARPGRPRHSPEARADGRGGVRGDRQQRPAVGPRDIAPARAARRRPPARRAARDRARGAWA